MTPWIFQCSNQILRQLSINRILWFQQDWGWRIRTECSPFWSQLNKSSSCIWLVGTNGHLHERNTHVVLLAPSWLTLACLDNTKRNILMQCAFCFGDFSIASWSTCGDAAVWHSSARSDFAIPRLHQLPVKVIMRFVNILKIVYTYKFFQIHPCVCNVRMCTLMAWKLKKKIAHFIAKILSRRHRRITTWTNFFPKSDLTDCLFDVIALILVSRI
jgi:hypothetical protein